MTTPQCEPTAGGPYWIGELQTVRFTVTCATGKALPGADFEVSPLPEGARYDAATATFEWKPGLKQAAVYRLTVRAKPFDEAGTVKVGVADAWARSDNVKLEDPAKYDEEFGLPVFHLSASRIERDIYRPATVVYRGHTYSAEVHYRGATSIRFPKKSFTVKFAKEDQFKEPARTGFDKDRSIALISNFNDNSYLRHKLSYDMWNRLPGVVPVRSFHVVVFLNGEYHGLYTLVEHVTKHHVEDFGLSEDGNLYKARSWNANFSYYRSDGTLKESLHEGFEKKDGTPEEGQPGAFDDLEEFVDWVAGSTTASFHDEMDARLRVDDYEGWWHIVVATTASDSGAKNAFHYHDPKGGKWRFIPWDFDSTFGQGWDTRRVSASWVMGLTGDNELFRRMFSDGAHAASIRGELLTLLDGDWSKEWVLGRVDSMVKQIDASAVRDEEKWGAAYRSYSLWADRTDFTTYKQEVSYLKAWIPRHWAAMESKFED